MRLSHKINKSPEFIFDYLIDMNKFASIHPVISKIESKGGNQFLVFETLKFGFIPYSFTYPVTIESNKEKNEVQMKAIVMKMHKVGMTFNIRQENNHSIVEEEISFRSPLPIKSMMSRIFKKQHEQFFKNMNELKG